LAIDLARKKSFFSSVAWTKSMAATESGTSIGQWVSVVLNDGEGAPIEGQVFTFDEESKTLVIRMFALSFIACTNGY
jgi:hypothetical protein